MQPPNGSGFLENRCGVRDPNRKPIVFLGKIYGSQPTNRPAVPQREYSEVVSSRNTRG